jgi:creatinine amidohydrolase
MKLVHTHREQLNELSPYVDTILLPVGALAAQAAHAPLGVDLLIVRRLGEIIEESLTGRVCLLPEVAYGLYDVVDHPGTIDSPAPVLADYIYHLLRGFQKRGMQYAVLLSGHEGNFISLQLASERLRNDGWKVLLINWRTEQEAADFSEFYQWISGTPSKVAAEKGETFLRELGTRLIDDVISLWK